MSQYALSAADEYPHAPGPETHFNESVYMNAFDHARRMGGWMRIGNRVNEGYAELSVCLYLPDGRIACQFQRPSIAHNEAFSAGGLRVDVVEPLRRLDMRYAGELLVIDDPALLRHPKRLFAEARRAPASVEWRHEGISPTHGGVPTDPAQQTLYGRDFSLGHFNQHTRVRGEIRIGEECWPVDGYGWRDHSWGPRYWQAPWYYRWLTANFDRDLGFMLSRVAKKDGPGTRGGFVWENGQIHLCDQAEISTEFRGEDTYHQKIEAVLKSSRSGREWKFTGDVMSLIPLRNRRQTPDGEWLTTRISEGMTRWEMQSDEHKGKVGYGLSEYLDQIIDGQPVGTAE